MTKICSHFFSNLDELFMVRVGSLFDLQKFCPSDIDKRSGMTPSQQLEKIYEAIPGLMELKKQIYTEAFQDLRSQGVWDLAYIDLSAGEQKYIKQFFKSNIPPIIFPIIIGSHHPAPHLENKELYLAALLQDKQGKSSLGLIPISNTLPAFVVLSEAEPLRYIQTENILLHWASRLFGSYTMLECIVAAVTRNADLSFDDENFEDIALDFRSRITSLLKSRNHLNVVRLELNSMVSESFQVRLARMVHDRPDTKQRQASLLSL